jgi:hypothetical protein
MHDRLDAIYRVFDTGARAQVPNLELDAIFGRASASAKNAHLATSCAEMPDD